MRRGLFLAQAFCLLVTFEIKVGIFLICLDVLTIPLEVVPGRTQDGKQILSAIRGNKRLYSRNQDSTECSWVASIIKTRIKGSRTNRWNSFGERVQTQVVTRKHLINILTSTISAIYDKYVEICMYIYVQWQLQRVTSVTVIRK